MTEILKWGSHKWTGPRRSLLDWREYKTMKGLRNRSDYRNHDDLQKTNKARELARGYVTCVNKSNHWAFSGLETSTKVSPAEQKRYLVKDTWLTDCGLTGVGLNDLIELEKVNSKASYQDLGVKYFTLNDCVPRRKGLPMCLGPSSSHCFLPRFVHIIDVGTFQRHLCPSHFGPPGNSNVVKYVRIWETVPTSTVTFSEQYPRAGKSP